MSRAHHHLPIRRSSKLAAGVVIVTAAAMASSTAQASAVHPAVTSHVHIYRSTLSAAQIKAYSKNANTRVIVLLRNQFPETLKGGVHQLTKRANVIGAAQRPVVSELRSLSAPGIKRYSFINAVAATVSKAEIARLKADPAVRAVVADRKVTLDAGTSATAPSTTAATTPATDPVNTTPGICGTAKTPLLQPEALGRIDATTAHHGVTGKGVRIAVFPDGLDPNIPDFIRPNGTHAIFDYRDFSGDGPNGVTGGGEAFGDASSIISQGRQSFNLSQYVNPALPLPANCDIRIKGVAPGASVAVMKVFGTEDSFDSTILQGLDWAVSHDHVNILSESFGENPVPDPGTDPISVFDAEAVAHGITVVASSGDAGTTNTIGGPAAQSSGIISAAASTDFQLNAQLSEHGYQLSGFKGWESDNVAPFSSGGFTAYGPNSVDVIAPGNDGWADCSTNTDVFEECADSFGGGANPPPIEAFGGTSEAAPITAGVAALVIQAYHQTHGSDPSATVVKQIIMNSATDLNEPANEQGAGQVNAKRAVALARSFHHASASHGSTASALAVTPSKIETTSTPGSAQSATVTVTNEGAHSTTLAPQVQQFGPKHTIVNKAVTYAPTSASTPTYLYWTTGLPEPYAEQSFTVPAGYQRLLSRIGYPADPNDFSQTVSEVLFDPAGKIAADSQPQGAPLGFSQVEIRDPEPGVWHAIYFSRPLADAYSGPISTTVTVQKLEDTAGTVSPASATLASGASKTFTVHYRTPSAAGDASAAVSFGTGSGVVPLLSRSLVTPTISKSGTFSTELTDGNGRMGFPGQEIPYQFVVPNGIKDIDVNVHIADPGYQVIAVLADPNGSPVDVQESTFTDLTTTNPDGSNPTDNDQTLHLSWQSPVAGRWNLELGTLFGSASGKTSSTISGSIAFNTVRTSSSGVPDSATKMLTPDVATPATITVKNTGNSPEIYYVDPRESTTSDYALGWYSSPNGTLPITPTATSSGLSDVIVPPDTSNLTMVANSTRPVNFTTNPSFGTPEIPSSTGTTAVATYKANDVAASVWDCPPTLIGPFTGAAPTTPYSCAAFAVTNTINDDIQSQGGNLWDNATDPGSPNVFNPADSVVVAPGASTTIHVTITPSEAEEGETVSGYLAVQTLDVDQDFPSLSSDELVHIPYTYSVAVPAQ